MNFRRVFIEHGATCIETTPNTCWYLPNPTPEGKVYDPERMLRAVVKAQSVNLDLWKRIVP